MAISEKLKKIIRDIAKNKKDTICLARLLSFDWFMEKESQQKDWIVVAYSKHEDGFKSGAFSVLVEKNNSVVKKNSVKKRMGCISRFWNTRLSI